MTHSLRADEPFCRATSVRTGLPQGRTAISELSARRVMVLTEMPGVRSHFPRPRHSLGQVAERFASIGFPAIFAQSALISGRMGYRIKTSRCGRLRSRLDPRYGAFSVRISG